jgi:hypothetical protein
MDAKTNDARFNSLIENIDLFKRKCNKDSGYEHIHDIILLMGLCEEDIYSVAMYADDESFYNLGVQNDIKISFNTIENAIRYKSVIWYEKFMNSKQKTKLIDINQIIHCCTKNKCQSILNIAIEDVPLSLSNIICIIDKIDIFDFSEKILEKYITKNATLNYQSIIEFIIKKKINLIKIFKKHKIPIKHENIPVAIRTRCPHITEYIIKNCEEIPNNYKISRHVFESHYDYNDVLLILKTNNLYEDK